MSFKYLKPTFAVCSLLFATLDVLLIKVAIEELSDGSSSYEKQRKFYHPFVQGLAAYLGMLLCKIVYWVLRFRVPSCSESVEVPMCKWLLFILPTVFNIFGWLFVFVGLNFTYQSSYTTLRGASVVFTGLLSVAFLGRSIRVHMWVGIAILTVGLIFAGLAEVIFTTVNTDANGIVAGDLLIILSQIIFATQFVYEEKYLKKHNIPASLAVGLEGLFGSILLGVTIAPMYYIEASKPFSMNPGHLEDVWDALKQMRNNWHITAATVGLMLSSPISTYCGIKVTKELSATTRQVILSGRLLLLWIAALVFKWQPFDYRTFIWQFCGFIFLVVGIFVYLDFIFRPFLQRHKCLKSPRHVEPNEFHGGYRTRYGNDDEPLITP